MSANKIAINSRKLSPVSLTPSAGFTEWLSQNTLSLVLTTGNSNRAMCIGVNESGAFAALQRNLDCPGVLSTRKGRLDLISRYQLWRYQISPSPERTTISPRQSYVCGNLDATDMATPEQGLPYIAASRFNSVVRVSESENFEVVWRPSCQGDALADDTFHVSGIGLSDDLPAYVTACSWGDVSNNWRRSDLRGGVLLDIRQGEEVLASDLSMPSCPREIDGKIWLVQSGIGEFGYIDKDTGRFQCVAFVPGFSKAWVQVGRYAVVAVSRIGAFSLGKQLPISEKLFQENRQSQAGVVVVDLETGESGDYLQFEGMIDDVCGVGALIGHGYPELLGFAGQALEDVFTIDGALSHVQPSEPVWRKPELELGYQLVEDVSLAQVCEYGNGLMYPSLRELAKERVIYEPLHVVLALAAGQPVGMIVAETVKQNNTSKIISLFVLPAFRRRGIGAMLVSQMESVCEKKGLEFLDFTYDTAWENRATLERMLRRRGWLDPRPWMIVAKSDKPHIEKATWLDKVVLPEGYEIFPWALLSDEERALIERRQSEESWFPDNLTPFQAEGLLEKSNSLGLKYKGRVVGWMITHRLTEDTIQYTSMFVSKEKQGLARAIPLLTHAIKMQMETDVPYGIMQAFVDNTKMMAFVKRRLAPYLTELQEHYYARKGLQ